MAVMPPMKINIEFPFPALRVEVRDGSWDHETREFGPSTGLVLAGDVVLFTVTVPSHITPSAGPLTPFSARQAARWAWWC